MLVSLLDIAKSWRIDTVVLTVQYVVRLQSSTATNERVYCTLYISSRGGGVNVFRLYTQGFMRIFCKSLQQMIASKIENHYRSFASICLCIQ